MKYVCAITLTSCFFFTLGLAQKPAADIRLKGGSLSTDNNLLRKKINNPAFQTIRFARKYYTVIHFDQLPGREQEALMADLGVHLFDYLPNKAFLAEIDDSNAFRSLHQFHADGAYGLPPRLKLSPTVLSLAASSPRDPYQLTAVCFYGTMDKAEVRRALIRAGAELVATKIQPARVVFLKASPEVLQQIAHLPFVSYICPQRLEDLPLNYNNRATHSLDALQAFSGRNLQGDKVTIGVGDNSDPSTHIDFSGRLIQRNPTTVNDHGTHTTGTAGGAGLLNVKYKGMAPRSTLVSQYFSDILVNAQTYITDYDMVLTNNSYYSGLANCPGEGEYNSISNFVDSQLYYSPSLLHVFAAGNDGVLTCNPFPSSYATIKSGFQCAKNVLDVGQMDNSSDTLNQYSSRGPVSDGRLKPEIVAGGVSITSTYPYNSYGVESGTSMASPTVTGTLALVCERYRQLNAGQDPLGALLKAVVCNSADDLGPPGPDFSYGFGMLNARTSVETIERNQYFISTVDSSATKTFVINNLPSGVLQLKIMLYWPDPAASPAASTALVNNLDLTATAADGILHHPLILDPSPAGVANNAQEGIDSLNNIEQVVINNPVSGNVTIAVHGTSIPTVAQNFVVVYQIIYPSVTVVYPFGNETWVPGETENIRWNAWGGGANTFSIDYSADNGTTWNNINATVPAASRLFPWTVPFAATNNARIRVTQNAVGYSDVSSYPFTILGQPILHVANPCPGYAQMLWDSIPSATSYQILRLVADSMQVIATTTDTSYLLGGLNRDSSYWLGVAAVNNTTAGRRSISVNVTPNSGSCALAAFNNDFTVDSLIYPLTGRMYTSAVLGNSQIQVELKNLGTVSSSGPFNISYQINGGAVITESSSQVIAGGSTYDYTFSLADSYDFSAPGSYSIQVWVDYPGDPSLSNDTITTTIKQLQNDPIVLNPTFSEGFETAAADSYTSKTMGFTGLDRGDFNLSNANGRVRTFINTGFARTGSRCATLDQVIHSVTSTADSLITTFNLSNYSASDQIWLDFYYKNQGIVFSLPGDVVWIRGNDQAAWIAVDTLSIDPTQIGLYQPSAHINVSGVLAAASPAQSVSSSFQVKFGEQGFTSTNSVIPDGDLDNGYSFDDITFTRSTDDVGMLALLQPNLSNLCGLGNADTISVLVKSYTTDTLTNIPITYSINGNAVTETLPAIYPGQTVVYSFAHTADLSAYQNYSLSAWVSYPSDNYRGDDTLPTVNFQTTPLISTYPYLEGFENNNGYWYAQGINSDWQWGHPHKDIINKAANGNNAWVTNLTGNYNDNQQSYLYSPCFDLSSLSQPELSFSHVFQTEDDCDCDYHWMEYSTDDSIWTKLGAYGSGINWYDDSAKQAWQISDTLWHVSSIDIPTTATKVRFRIAFLSDPAVNFDGVAIDDVHIFDKASIYTGGNISSGLSQVISGNNWINFDAAGGRVAAINPNGQNLGNTSVGVFIHTGPVRDTSNQYYLDRNLVIQPSNPPAGPISVRFYFTDSEANRLIQATGCNTCTSIHDAYESGVTQFSSRSFAEEDSTLANDSTGCYHFLIPRQNMSIIPNDNGYYAEYQVNGFSEFWINGGGPAQIEPLAGILDSFSATRSNFDALLKWTTFQEINVTQFVVEKSTDSIHFFSIGEVTAKGTTNSYSSYQFTDTGLVHGNNYYRLKIMLSTGQSMYSPIRMVYYNLSTTAITVYPNPVLLGGTLWVSTPSNCWALELHDLTGRTIISQQAVGLHNSMYVANIAKGIYFLTIYTDGGKATEEIEVL
jgi:hypothetical protein